MTQYLPEMVNHYIAGAHSVSLAWLQKQSAASEDVKSFRLELFLKRLD